MKEKAGKSSKLKCVFRRKSNNNWNKKKTQRYYKDKLMKLEEGNRFINNIIIK